MTAPRAGAESILLVEDQAAVRALVNEVLSQQGYRVVEAANGMEALNVMSGDGEAIDLLITDVVMPQLGGPELAARLREDRPDLRVLFMSGYSDEPAMTILHDRASAFLQKPFALHELLVKVREMLD